MQHKVWLFLGYSELAIRPDTWSPTIYGTMADMTEPDVSSLLAQIDSLGKSLSLDSKQDAETRKKLRLAARDLTRAIEEPGDIVERVCFSVRNPCPLTL